MTLQYGTTYAECTLALFIMLNVYITSSTSVYDQWSVKWMKWNTCRGNRLWLLKIPLFSNLHAKVSETKHTVKFCPQPWNISRIFDCSRHYREAVTRLDLMTVQCPPVRPCVTILEMVNGLSQNLIYRLLQKHVNAFKFWLKQNTNAGHFTHLHAFQCTAQMQ
jgi:hypothetical protein